GDVRRVFGAAEQLRDLDRQFLDGAVLVFDLAGEIDEPEQLLVGGGEQPALEIFFALVRGADAAEHADQTVDELLFAAELVFGPRDRRFLGAHRLVLLYQFIAAAGCSARPTRRRRRPGRQSSST